jgi:hypothetical protein
MTGFRMKQYLSHSLDKTMCDFYNLTQGKHRSNQEYYDEFNSMVSTAEESGVTIGAHPAGVAAALKEFVADSDFPTTAEKIIAVKTATNRYLAVAFLVRADKICYATLLEEIENEFLQNKGTANAVSTNPKTVSEAYDYLCNYKRDPRNLSRLLGHNSGGENLNTGIAFAQDGKKDHDDAPTQEQAFATHSAPPSNGSNRQKKVCRRCGQDDHNSIECNATQDKVDIFRQSTQANTGVSQLINAVDWDGVTDTIHDDEANNWVFLQATKQVSFKSDGPTTCTKFNKDGSVAGTHKSNIFSQSNGGIPKTWYLLDNQSTCDIVSNPRLVTNLRKVDGHMQLATQAGTTTTNWMADVPGYYRPVWFHPGGIANILSMINMTAKYRVSYDSHHGEHPNKFCVHKADGSIRFF